MGRILPQAQVGDGEYLQNSLRKVLYKYTVNALAKNSARQQLLCALV
jgi:hypothetical protein